MARAQLTTQAQKLLTRFVREGAILRGDRPHLVYWAEQFASGAPIDRRHVLEALSRFEELGIPGHRREEPPGVLCEPQLVCRDFRPEATRPGVFIKGGSKLTPQEIAQYAAPCPEAPSPPPAPPCPPGFDVGEPFELGELSGLHGNDTQIIYATGRGQARFSAFYAQVSSDEVIPSHHPQNFQVDPRFPAELQERDYTRDVAEREKVILNSGRRFDPALLLNNTPSAVDGPPIVTPEGFVIGGNSRAMIIKRIQAEGGARADAYAQAMVELGPCLGLGGGEDVGVYGQMVVRVVPDFSGIRREEVSRALNRPLTQELAPEAAAPSLGALLTPRVLELATGEAGKTLAQNIRANNEDMARALQEASIITEQNRASWLVKERGAFVSRLSKAGQEKLSGAVMGAVLPDAELLASTPAAYRALYEELAPVLLGIRALGELAKPFDLLSAFQTAAQDLPELAGFRNAREAGNYIAQAPVFNGGLTVLSAPLEAAQMLLVMFIHSRNKTKRTELAKRFRHYGHVVSEYVAKARKAKNSLFGRNVRAPEPSKLQTELLEFEPVPELGIEPIVLLTSALLVGAGEREQAAGILTAAASAIADAPNAEVLELELQEALAELNDTKLTTKSARELVVYLVRVSSSAQAPASRLTKTTPRAAVLEILREQFQAIAHEARRGDEDDDDRENDEDFGDDEVEEVEEALFDPLEPQRPSSSFQTNEPKNAEEHVARMFGNFAPDQMRLQVWDNERGEREPPTSKGGKFYVWATRHDERGLTAKWRSVSLDVGEPFSLGEVPPAPGHGVLLDPEEPDDWKIHRVLWVPKSAREDFKEELRENRGRVQNANSPMLDPIWIDDVGTRRGGYSTRRPYTLEILGDESTDDEDDDELELEEMEEGELDALEQTLDDAEAELEEMEEESELVERELTQFEEEPAGGVEDYQERKQGRIEGYRTRAAALRSKAQALAEAGSLREEVTGIPFGQPVLVGHHSERRHRKALERSSQLQRKAREAWKRAEVLEERAAAAERNIGISSDDPDAVLLLRERLHTLKSLQDLMKRTNAILRSKKKSEEQKAEEVLALPGMSERLARAALAFDAFGRRGFEPWQLSNNSASIRRVQKRMADLQELRDQDSTTEEWGSGHTSVTLTDSVEDNRVMMDFASKPDKASRDTLKRNAFKWSPKNRVWQRKRGGWALRDARRVAALLTGQEHPNTAHDDEDNEPAPDQGSASEGVKVFQRVIAPSLEFHEHRERWKDEPPGSEGGYFYLQWTTPLGEEDASVCEHSSEWRTVLGLLTDSPDVQRNLSLVWWIPRRYAVQKEVDSCKHPTALQHNKVLPIWTREEGGLAGGINNPGHLKNRPARPAYTKHLKSGFPKTRAPLPHPAKRRRNQPRGWV